MFSNKGIGLHTDHQLVFSNQAVGYRELEMAVRANLFYIVTLAQVWVAPDFAQSLKSLKVVSFAPNHKH